jgi:hypothetical protein
MSDTLEHLIRRWALNLDSKQRLPIDVYTQGRDDLASLFSELEFRVGVEVGVERAFYSEVLLKANPDLTLFSVDPWKSHRAYRDHTSQKKLDAFYEEAKVRLSPFGKRSRILCSYSLDATDHFRSGSIDFVYIDANHCFDPCMLDIIHWSPRVRSGGIVAGHDFVRRPPQGYVDWGVIKAVTAYAQAHDIRPWFTIGGGKGGELRSWLWVKP